MCNHISGYLVAGRSEHHVSTTWNDDVPPLEYCLGKEVEPLVSSLPKVYIRKNGKRERIR